jgi:hypothetical protein
VVVRGMVLGGRPGAGEGAEAGNRGSGVGGPSGPLERGRQLRWRGVAWSAKRGQEVLS